MGLVYEKLLRCFDDVKKKIDFKPFVALVLGSGLGDFADQIQISETLDYYDIDGFPVSTVQGHKGRFVFGYIGKVPVVIMQGRIHYYEGYPMSDVVLPIRLMKLMGAKILFLTNAAGGISNHFQPGDLMMITDQISSFVPSPLIGENMERLGERFPDMSEIYAKELQEIIQNAAETLNIGLQKGIYVQLSGPNYETPQEVRMCRILGGNAVGMSTGVEAVAARHMGMKICGISCISNLACGLTDHPLSHKEVQDTADRTAVQLKGLLNEAIQNMINL